MHVTNTSGRHNTSDISFCSLNIEAESCFEKERTANKHHNYFDKWKEPTECKDLVENNTIRPTGDKQK